MTNGETMPGSASALRIVTSSAWLLGAEAGMRGISFVTILYLSRTLTLAGMGIVEFGMGVFGVMQVIAGSGVDVLAMRGAARRPAQVPRLIGRSLLVAWMQLAASFVVLVAAAIALPQPPVMRLAAVLFGLAAVLVPLGVRAALVARERMRAIGIAAPLGQAVFLALCMAGVRGPEHVLRVALFWIAAVGVRSGVQLAAFVGEYGMPRLPRTRQVLRWQRTALGVGAGSVARGLMVVIDVIVLGLLVAPEQVAPYAIANKVPLFLATLAGLVHVALFPSVARIVFSGDARRLGEMQGVALKVLLGVALPGALCLSLIAEPLLVLLFTAKFRAAVPVFHLLVWRFPLAATSGLFRVTLWAKSPATEARVAVQVLATTLPAVLVGAAVAGPVGAAWGVLLGEAVAVGLYAKHAAPRGLGLGHDGWLARVAVGASLVLGLRAATAGASAVQVVAAALLTWVVASAVVNAAYVRNLWSAMR